MRSCEFAGQDSTVDKIIREGKDDLSVQLHMEGYKTTRVILGGRIKYLMEKKTQTDILIIRDASINYYHSLTLQKFPLKV